MLTIWYKIMSILSIFKIYKTLYYHMNQQFHFWVYTQKEWKQGLRTYL